MVERAGNLESRHEHFTDQAEKSLVNSGRKGPVHDHLIRLVGPNFLGQDPGPGQAARTIYSVK
jgi:hypothetical protein